MNFMQALRSGKSKTGKQQSFRQARKLLIEPLEERQMLSVSPMDKGTNSDMDTFVGPQILVNIGAVAEGYDNTPIQTFDIGINAVANNWSGGGSGNWNEASNWSLGHVPTEEETANIPGATPRP